MGRKIVFIYNAKAGFVNGIIDTLHKFVSPSTYTCKLCELTYGLTSMHSEWKEYITHLKFETEFLHKDELEIKYPKWVIDLPAVVMPEEDTYRILISASDFKSIQNNQKLIHVLNAKLENITPDPPLKS